jgi:hypothetical protein
MLLRFHFYPQQLRLNDPVQFLLPESSCEKNMTRHGLIIGMGAVRTRAKIACICTVHVRTHFSFFPRGSGYSALTVYSCTALVCHTVVIRESARESIAGPTISPSPDFQPVARPIGASIGRDARAMSKDADSDRSRRGRAASSRARETASRPEPHERFRRELVQRFVTCYPTIVECSK